MMRRHDSRVGVASLAVWALLVAPALGQKSDKDSKDNSDAKKPKLSLKAQPAISMSPSRVVLTAEITGGANDFEEFYCPTVVWEWGDGTQSEASADCAPYETGKSEIKAPLHRRARLQSRQLPVQFHLKQRNKTVGMANVSIQVRPGVRDVPLDMPVRTSAFPQPNTAAARDHRCLVLGPFPSASAVSSVWTLGGELTVRGRAVTDMLPATKGPLVDLTRVNSAEVSRGFR